MYKGSSIYKIRILICTCTLESPGSISLASSPCRLFLFLNHDVWRNKNRAEEKQGGEKGESERKSKAWSAKSREVRRVRMSVGSTIVLI